MQIVSHSQLRSLNRCRWQWGIRYLKRLYSKTQSDAMDVGKLVHNALAQLYGLGEINWEVLRSEFVGGLRSEIFTEGKRVVNAYLAHDEVEFPGQILAVEFPFQVRLPFNTILVGWIDLITKVDGKLWLWDHKTSSKMTKRITRSERDQLSLYAWGLMRLGAPIGGFGVNRLTTAKKPTFARFTEEVDKADLIMRSKNFMASCKALPSESISMANLPRSFELDCDFRCDYKELCQLDLYGKDLNRLIAEEFRYSERGDPAAYLEQYNIELPKWWLEEETV